MPLASPFPSTLGDCRTALAGASNGAGSAVDAALGAGKEPGLAAEGDAAQGPFRCIVRETNPAIVEEPGEGGSDPSRACS
jgi:hypothetical protein